MNLYLYPGHKTSRNWSKPIKWRAFLNIQLGKYLVRYQFDLPMIGSSDDLELFLEIVDKVGLQPFDGKLLDGNDNKVCGAIC